MPTLAVATARCKARLLQNLVERGVWQWGVCEFPRRKGRAHDVVQFHARSSLSRVQLLEYSQESMAIWGKLVNGMAFLSPKSRARDLRSSRLSRIFSTLLR